MQRNIFRTLRALSVIAICVSSAGVSQAQMQQDKAAATPSKDAKADKDTKARQQSKKKAAPQTAPKAVMPTSPAPTTGSMPKSGNVPAGKLGTEATSKGKLGTDPKPGDPQTRPPRPQ